MNHLKLLIKSLIISLIIVGCANNESIIDNEAVDNSSDLKLSKKEIAFNLIDLMQNNNFKNILFTQLKNQTPSIALSTILNQNTNQTNTKAFKNLEKQVAYLNEQNSTKNKSVEVLELWLQNEINENDFDNVLISFTPEGNENTWTKVEAYTLTKELVYLDPKEAPKQPVIVIENSGFEALKLEVEKMNEILRKEGLQNERFTKTKFDKGYTPANKANLETTKLERIVLDDDQEPWISGAAEIYAITSGIKDNNNTPEIKIIPMYYLDYKDEVYYPNQILLFWDDYQYQAANIQLFEKDSGENYQELTQAIVSGVFQIIGIFTAQPWVNVLGQVAGAIIQAMPSGTFTNDDDYVDSFYTIEKNKTYTNYKGAARNATVTLKPFTVLAN